MPTVSSRLYKWVLWRGATLEDFADRLNHFWTFGLLLLFAGIIIWKQCYNSPIRCWAPAQFTHNHVKYVEDICWNSYGIQYPRDIENAEREISETFNITFDMPFLNFRKSSIYIENDDIDESNSLHTKMSTTRTLYQWLPVILCFQALLFKLPNLLMYILHSFSGISFDKIAGLTSGYENMTLQERGTLSRQTGRYIYTWCQQFEKWLPWRQLTLLWLVVKVLYCINVVVQICLIDAFLTTRDPPIDNSTWYADLITGNMFENNATIWKESPAFPRRVLCDFSIRSLRNIHRYTVQCQITANYFNEFLYMFIWVWFLFVAIVTILSLVTWLLTTLTPFFRKRYIARAISLSDDLDITSISKLDFEIFCDMIGEDGLLALKLTSANSSEHIVRDVVCSMWRHRLAKLNVSRPLVLVQPSAPVAVPVAYPVATPEAHTATYPVATPEAHTATYPVATPAAHTATYPVLSDEAKKME